MENKSPAFQWYPKDILSSARVAEMSLEEEGAYRRALDFCWLNGSIPSDPERCARLIGKGASILVATVVQAMFNQDTNDPSKMVHERLEIERIKQESWRIKSVEGGKASAKIRQQNKLEKMKGGSKMVATNGQPKGNSSSSSSSSNNTSFDVLQEQAHRTAENLSAFFEPLRKIYGTNTLTNEKRWFDVVVKAEGESITPEQLAQSLQELLARKSEFPVTPENVFNRTVEKRAQKTIVVAPKEIPNTSIYGVDYEAEYRKEIVADVRRREQMAKNGEIVN